MRENAVHLCGVIADLPTVIINENGDAIRADMIIQVLRRSKYEFEQVGEVHMDCPVIRTKNTELINYIRDNCTKGDLVIIKGAISSRNVKKTSICPHCSEKNKKVGLLTYITPIDIININGFTRDYLKEHHIKPDNMELKGTAIYQALKKVKEVSNQAYILGSLANEPDFYSDEAEGTKITQYLLTVNRKFKIKEDEETKDQDFMWCKTYGSQAEQDFQSLHKGSLVLVNGAIQTRQFTRKNQCEYCGEEYEWKESVVELVPYSVEYVEDCNILVTKEQLEAYYDKSNFNFDGIRSNENDDEDDDDDFDFDNFVL